MRITTQTIRTFAIFGFGRSHAWAITFVGSGVRAVTNALAFHPAALTPEPAISMSKLSAPARFAENCESGWGVGGAWWRSVVVYFVRRLLQAVRILRRIRQRFDARLRDTMSLASAPRAAHAHG